MICEYFRATGAHETVQRLSDLFTMGLQNDDVHDFDVRWDQALRSVSELLSDVNLEELYKSLLQDSDHLQLVLALYDQETARNNGKPNYARLKQPKKTSYWSDYKNSKLQGSEQCCGKKISHQEFKSKEIPRSDEKWDSVFSG